MIKLVKLSANNFKQLRAIEMRFPEAGSVLVEGRNEAGKSTLFEAIFFGLFGRPLVTGTAIEDLIAYDANDALVELTIALPDGQMVVQRKVRRTKARVSADARLRIYDADGEAGEEVKGASAVNQRIQQELKLDADAFLNSCFVEQKKLEKLEGMTQKDRETSLMRLLNLDRLLDREKSLKITLDDNRRLTRLQQRMQLAETMERIPAVMKRGREVSAALTVIALKEGLSTLETHRAGITDAEARREALAEPIAALEARVRRIDALKAAIHEMNLAAAKLSKAEQLDHQAAGLQEEIAALDRVECEEVPAQQTRHQRLGVLRSRWERLIALEDEIEEVRVDLDRMRRRLAGWESAQELMQDARRRLADVAEPIRAAEDRLRRIETFRAALGEVEMARVRLGQVEQQRQAVAAVEAEIAELDRVEREDLPALHERRRRAGVLRSQWARIRQLHLEVERLTADADSVRARLTRLEELRAETARIEARVAEETARVAALEAEAERLEGAEHAVSVRQALEDWQAADHARRSLSELERQIARAESDHRTAEEESAAVAAKMTVLKAAARRRLAVGGGLAGLAVLLIPVLFATGIAALWGLFAVLAGAGLWNLSGWRAVQSRAATVADRWNGLQGTAREAQNALVRLEGQYENAQASQGAAAGRLETAAVRLEALVEPVPSGAAEAARRLANLVEVSSEDNPDAIRARLTEVRGELATLRGGLDEQNRTLAARRRELDAEKEPLLRKSADTLERRAARITETILERWLETATERAAALAIPVSGDAAADREACGRAIAQIEAEVRVTVQRLDGRAAKREQVARAGEAIVAARLEVSESFTVLPDVRPETEAPASADACEALRAGLEAEMAALDEDSARAELTVRRAEKSEAESDRTAGERQARALQEELLIRFGAPCREDGSPVEEPSPEEVRAHVAASLAALEARISRITETIVEPWTKAAAARAAALGIPAVEDADQNRVAASRAESAVEAAIAGALRRLEQRPVLRARVEQVEAQAAAERRQVAAALKALAAVRPDAEAPQTRADADALRAGLEEERDGLDEESARENLEARREERAQAENERTYHERTMEQTVAYLRENADRLRLPADLPLTAETLAGALPMWDGADPACREELEAEFEDLRGQKGYLEGRRDDLARTLGLDPSEQEWDLAKERAEYEELKHDHAVRDQAVTILQVARDRIADKVLPYTIEHMRRILPALTMDRYHDARLTDDYKIEVWDERAGLWKAKNIFSGGTRDQFSLALRLAFAMATLPQERGAAPGFIFLDEPLSSFDVERSDALMYLLTRGEIAETFDQIFVISHNQSLAANEFAHRIRMDGGRITEISEEMQPAPLELEAE